MVAPYIRRQFSDTVSYTDQLSGGINNSVTSFTLKSGTTFPDGSVGPFVCCIDPGIFGLEEKVLVGSRSGAVCSSVTRGFGGTTPQVHSANAVVLHTIDQRDLDEANQAVFNTLGQITTSGDMLYANSPTTMTRVGIGAANNVMTSSGAAPRWSSMLSAIETAFTSANQIIWGTGNGVGTLTSLLTAIEQQFASSGQLLVGTGSATGELLSVGAAGTSLTVGGADPSGLQWQAILGEPLALTGATQATRFVGATSSGAPGSGTFALGDLVVDQSGTIWICTTAGSPGTWKTPLPTGIPAGRMFPTVQTVIQNTTATVGSMAQDFVKGGVTFSSGANSLTVPTTGIYQVSWNINFQSAGNAPTLDYWFGADVYVNGSSARHALNNVPPTTHSAAMSVGGADIISLNANDALTLVGSTQSPSDASNTATNRTWLSVCMVSA